MTINNNQLSSYTNKNLNIAQTDNSSESDLAEVAPLARDLAEGIYKCDTSTESSNKTNDEAWHELLNSHGLEEVAIVDDDNGYDAAIVRGNIDDDPENEYFIVNRGTQKTSWGDIKADHSLWNGNSPKQLESAQQLLEVTKKAMSEDSTNPNQSTDLFTTGHSLGGSLSQLLSAGDKNVKAITFNAYGVKNVVEENPSKFTDIGPVSLNSRILNYVVEGDIISDKDHWTNKWGFTGTEHIGETIYLDNEGPNRPFAAHRIGLMNLDNS